MSRDFKDEAQKEEAQRVAYQAWRQARVESIHANVTVYDVLQHFGVVLKQKGNNREEQISCPFHGKDAKPSARVFPSGRTGRSSVWCYVCQEHWDTIALWKKFQDNSASFTQVLSAIERQSGLKPPDAPKAVSKEAQRHAEEVAELTKLFDVVERRLQGAKDSFDMVRFFTVGSILDRLRYDFEQNKIPFTGVHQCLMRVLDKIGEKCRGT